jgi:hypothetical protein
MQQATSAIDEASEGMRTDSQPVVGASNQFVINLCSSTTPVALTPPDHAGLKRFTFFVSRRREEGRERFRLSMGFFQTQEEAEKLLDIVREIYPGAWAGLAPGQRLRAAAARAGHAAAATAPAAASSSIAATTNAAATSTAAATTNAAASSAAMPVSMPADSSAAATPPARAAASTELELLPDSPRHLGVAAAEPPATRSLNNVRAAIASLDDGDAQTPTLSPIPELRAARAQTGAAVSTAGAEISGEAALSVLEGDTVRAPTLPAARPASAAPQLPPAAQTRNDKTCFAVQLMWSVQPIDIAQVPQLAIFSAYTLYGAEGNRDGRRWYGLRLGFFTDAVSAKQVAHYVRSEFATVSVVPVTVRERERAKLAATRPSLTPAAAAVPAADAAAAPGAAAAPAAAPKGSFEFIDDKQAAPAAASPAGAAAPAAAAGAARALGARAGGRGAPGKRAKLRTQMQVNGRAKSKPMTLEETLEILGAGELKMDDGRSALINEPETRKQRPQQEKSRTSRLGRLFERLSDRLGS